MSSRPMGKMFYSDGSGNARPSDPSIAPGWYYQIDVGDPRGPFETKAQAKRVAQARQLAFPRAARRDANG